MLPKRQRNTRRQVEQLIRDGKRVNSPLFTLVFFVNKEEKNIKISASVPKKVSNKAVVRNKIRRRTYHSLRHFLSNIKTGTSLLFIAKKGVDKISFKELSSDLEQILVRSGLFVEKKGSIK